MTNPTILSIYEAMSVLMEGMLAAAIHSDWNALNALTQPYVAHVWKLKQHDQMPTVLVETQRLRTMALIENLLSSDAQIRELIDKQFPRLPAPTSPQRADDGDGLMAERQEKPAPDHQAPND